MLEDPSEGEMLEEEEVQAPVYMPAIAWKPEDSSDVVLKTAESQALTSDLPPFCAGSPYPPKPGMTSCLGLTGTPGGCPFPFVFESMYDPFIRG